jgi:hypothetical protein
VTELARHVDLVAALLARDTPRVASGLSALEGGLRPFAQFARRNQLSGFLHTVVSSPEVLPAVPADLRAEFQSRYVIESRKRARLLPELGLVLDGFRERGIECILLKGPQLAIRYYGAEDRRVYWDLDVLVRQSDLDAGRALLSTLGYQQHSPMLFGERVSIAVAHALDYAKGDVGLDLHWKIGNHPSFQIDYERLWRRSEAWQFGGRSVRVLSPDYEIALNLISALKDLERGAFRLRSFVDLWMLLDAVDGTLDWQSFFSERREETVRLITVSMLRLFLTIMRAEDRFPRLAAALDREPVQVPVRTGDAAAVLLEPRLIGPQRRAWTSRLYHSRMQHIAWWAVTLPVRLNVHKPGKVKRLSHGLRTWLKTHP